MAISRRACRKKIMTILYQITLYKDKKVEYDIDEVIRNNVSEDNEFISGTVKGIIQNEENIVSLANKYLNNWTLNRLGYTDQALIKLGIYEIMYTDTPNKVCINEAIELSKQYSDDDVVKMINGVLDKVYKNEVNHE